MSIPSTPTPHARIQYEHTDTHEPLIGTVLDTHENTITVTPIASATTGEPITETETHELNEHDTYRVIA